MKVLSVFLFHLALTYAPFIGLAIKNAFRTAKVQVLVAKNRYQYNKIIKHRDVTYTVICPNCQILTN